MRKLLPLGIILSTLITMPSFSFAVSPAESNSTPYSGIFVGGYVGSDYTNYSTTTSITGTLNSDSIAQFESTPSKGVAGPIGGIRIGLLAPVFTSSFRWGAEIFSEYTGNNVKMNALGAPFSNDDDTSAFNNIEAKIKNGLTAGADILFGVNFNKIGLVYGKLGGTVSKLDSSLGANGENALSQTSYKNGFLYGFGIERMITDRVSLNLGYQRIQTSNVNNKVQLQGTFDDEEVLAGGISQKIKLVRSDVLLAVNYYFG